MTTHTVEVSAKTADKIDLRSLLLATSTTYHQSAVSIRSGESTSVAWPVPFDKDELEWHRIVNTPRVRQALRHLAAEARRQIAAGETEEGGFAVE